MSIVTQTKTFRGAVRASHHDWLSRLILSASDDMTWIQGDVDICFHAAHFPDHRACVEELAEVIRKHRKADKPAEAV